MALSKFLDPKNDFAFKKIFGTERNKDILIHFLNDMLGFEPGAQICTLSFLKPIQDPEVAAKKQSIVDVLCVDEKGSQYIVEMQVAKIKGFEKRAQYYAAKAYVNQLNQSEIYAKLKEIIFIAITDFVMFPEKPEYKSDHIILDKNSYVHDLKNFSFTFLELPKFNTSLEDLETMVEKWAYFFKYANETTEEDFKTMTEQNFILERAYTELNRFSWSENQLKLYEQELKSAKDLQAMLEASEDKGLQLGLEKAIAQGVQQGESALLLHLIRHTFKDIPESILKKIQQGSPEDLLRWGSRVLENHRLEQIFEP
jgi:predicted transposase/invertase (TIGR01784 family)